MKQIRLIIFISIISILMTGCPDGAADPAGEATSVKAPVITPEPDTHDDYVEVSIGCETEAVLIYYTLNGTDPTATSHLYTAPFIIYESTEVRVVAFKEGLDPSTVVIASYTVVEDPSGDIDGDGLLNSEEETYGTSKILADTDGDGYTDYEEIRELGFDASSDPAKFNPLIADIPEIQISLTSPPKITLDMQSSISSATTISNGNTTETASTVTSAETTTNTTSVESSVSSSRKTFSLGSRPLLASPVGTHNYKTTTTKEESFSWSEEQSQENRESLSRTETLSQEEGFTFTGGELGIAVKIINAGNISFTLQSLLLSAVRLDPYFEENTIPIGNLALDSTSTFPDQTLVPGEEIASLVFIKDDLTLSTAQDLLRSKSGLIIAPTLYELLNSEGVAFAHNMTEISARTATVIIDYGPGTSRTPESYKVATNSTANGISMKTLLTDILHIPYTEDEGLTSLRDVSEDLDAHKSWNLLHLYTLGGEETFDFYARIEALYTGFEDLEIKAGEVLQFFFMDDADMDEIGAREEAIFGTDPTLTDTDSDDLNDGVEIYGIEVSGLTRDGAVLYTSPLAADSDNDGTNDKVEQGNGTDPVSRFPVSRDFTTKPDRINDMLALPGGGVLIAGYSNYEQLYYDAERTIKFGTTGTWQIIRYLGNGIEDTGWSNTIDYNFQDRFTSPEALVMGSDGSIYAAGVITEESNVAHEMNWHIVKYDSSGQPVTGNWPLTIDFDGAMSTSLADSALAIAAFDGYIYVGGYGTNSSTNGRDWAIKKFNEAGEEQTSWDKFEPISSGNGTDEVIGLAVDSVGDLYAVGHAQNVVATDSGQDIHIVKYLANGSVQWIQNVEFAPGKDDTVKAVSISEDRLFICGSADMDDGLNTQKWWMKAFALDLGTEDDAWDFSGGAQRGHSYANDIHRDQAGNIYLAIQTQPYGDSPQWQTKRYGPDKGEDSDWSETFSVGDIAYPQAIATSPAGEVYMAAEVNPDYYESNTRWHIRKYYTSMEE